MGQGIVETAVIDAMEIPQVADRRTSRTHVCAMLSQSRCVPPLPCIACALSLDPADCVCLKKAYMQICQIFLNFYFHSNHSAFHCYSVMSNVL